MVSSARDWEGDMLYYRRDVELGTVSTRWGEFPNVVAMTPALGDPKISKIRQEAMLEIHRMKVVDGRKHLAAGKTAWSLEENGFCFIDRPEYNFEDHEVGSQILCKSPTRHPLQILPLGTRPQAGGSRVCTAGGGGSAAKSGCEARVLDVTSAQGRTAQGRGEDRARRR
jgi:hypothetical protein